MDWRQLTKDADIKGSHRHSNKQMIKMDWRQLAKDAGIKGGHGHSDKQMIESAIFLAVAVIALFIISGILAIMGLLK